MKTHHIKIGILSGRIDHAKANLLSQYTKQLDWPVEQITERKVLYIKLMEQELKTLRVEQDMDTNHMRKSTITLSTALFALSIALGFIMAKVYQTADLFGEYYFWTGMASGLLLTLGAIAGVEAATRYHDWRAKRAHTARQLELMVDYGKDL